MKTTSTTTYTTGTASRYCARCGRELTDPASMAAGVGPECRRLTNDLLARAIDADVPAAQRVVREALARGLFVAPGEAVARLDEVIGAVEDGVLADWREVVATVEWCLSWEIGTRLREALYALTEALGYGSLVALWRGEVVKGAAVTVLAFANRLMVRGPRPPTAARRQLEAVPGSLRSRDGRWSWPASSAAEAARVVRSVYLRVDLAALQAAVESLTLAAVAEHEAPAVVEAAVVVDAVGPTRIAIRSPWSSRFLAELKLRVERDLRRWDREARVWLVDGEGAAVAVELAREVFGPEQLRVSAAANDRLRRLAVA